MGIRNHTHEMQSPRGSGTFHVVYRDIDMPEEGIIRNVYAFPEHTLLIRAGEYGIDPEDTETLLDAVTFELDPAHPKPLDYTPPLFTAKTLEDARKEYLDDIGQMKEDHSSTGKNSGPECKVRRKLKDKHVVLGHIVMAARMGARENYFHISGGRVVSQSK